MVNLQWSQLAFLFFHHCSRDQATVSTWGLNRKLLPLRLQKSEGQWCWGGGRAVHRRPAVLPWSSGDFWGMVVTRLCLLGLLSLFVTSFLIRSWEVMYQCVDLTCFSETLCNRSFTFMCCYLKKIFLKGDSKVTFHYQVSLNKEGKLLIIQSELARSKWLN